MPGEATSGSAYGQFMVVLIIFACVLALTYFVTRWISGYQKNQRAGTNIELIESAPLATNKHIQIVRIGKKYVALSVCKDTVTLLTELSEDEIVIQQTGATSMTSFKEIISRVKNSNESENE